MNNFEKLQRWYLDQCNGEWEHDCGITIESLDNPGWRVRIDLSNTILQGKEFKEIQEGVNQDKHPVSRAWLNCKVENNKFSGAGDPTKLEEIIKIFLDWTDK